MTTTPVQLTFPVSQTDYRSGFSIILQCPSAILIGGSASQDFQIAANTPFSLNELNPGELPYLRTVSGSATLQELWQGL